MSLTYRTFLNLLSQMDEDHLDQDVTLVLRNDQVEIETYPVDGFVEPGKNSSEVQLNGSVPSEGHYVYDVIEEVDDSVLNKGHPFILFSF